MPASINAFALGAKTANSRSHFSLERSTVRVADIDAKFSCFGVTAVSGQDSLIRDERQGRLGVFLYTDGKQINPANSFWNGSAFLISFSIVGVEQIKQSSVRTIERCSVCSVCF